MTKLYFLTGTDTEVGKTVASIALLQSARLAGFTAVGYKPVASGSEKSTKGLLQNSDVLALQRNSSVMLAYEAINLYTFAEPTSPHISSNNEKKPISLSVLSTGLRLLEKKANWILIEGAGGWFTPLTKEMTFAHWVKLEQLPVILVVGIKLGCINHALLTNLAIRQAGLRLAGWIANNATPQSRRHKEYLSTLKYMLNAPFLGEIPWLNNPKNQNSLNNYLSLKYLNGVKSLK